MTTAKKTTTRKPAAKKPAKIVKRESILVKMLKNGVSGIAIIR